MRGPLMRGLSTVLACSAVLSTAVLSGCAPEEVPMSTTWQITNVYVTEDKPSQSPGSAYLIFGNSTVTGSTGCGQFQGLVAFTPSFDAPEKARFSDMKFAEPTCQGSGRYFHDQLVTLLDGEFEVRRQSDEILLSKPTELDRPGVRLVAAR